VEVVDVETLSSSTSESLRRLIDKILNVDLWSALSNLWVRSEYHGPSLFFLIFLIFSSFLSSGFSYCTRVYPKVSGLTAWNENCKWYSSLPLGAVLSLFYESV
jgi:hypothetical protein